MHIELTEMLRCPEEHRDEFLVLSTSEMNGRMVWRGIVGCPVCEREYVIFDGIVDFTQVLAGTDPKPVRRTPAPPALTDIDPQSLQALLDLSGPGGYVILLGSASRHAVGLAALMGGIHFVGINAPVDYEELPILSLLQTESRLPLRAAMARGVLVGPELLESPQWLTEAARVLLRGRRLVLETESPNAPSGVTRLAAGKGLWVGEKT
jgi:uncharacterized protein YbaR (Trm112 family)